MSRLYFIAEMKHSSLGIDLPVFKITTADYTGGNYNVQGLYPSSIATLAGKGPELTKQERFDLKFNLNKKRTSMSLIINTKKHLPAFVWDTEKGVGELPLGIKSLLPMITGSKSSKDSKDSKDSKRSESRKTGNDRSRSQRSSSSGRYRDDRHNSRYDDYYDDIYDEEDEEDDRSEKHDRYDDRRSRHHRSYSESRSRR